MSDKNIINLIKLIEVLQNIQIQHDKLSEQEKKDNEIKMGDIYY